MIDDNIWEKLNNCSYKSNSSMMVKNYDTIYKYLSIIFDNYKYDKIVIYMRIVICDGLCLGYYMCKDIKRCFK